MNVNKLIKELRRDEGVRNTVYKDSLGIETIGVGRNLVDRGLSDTEIDLLLENDIILAERDARDLIKVFDELSDARQRVVVNMSFNLGKPRLSGFKRMIAAINDHDYHQAAIEMLSSRWAKQVGIRADRLADMMLVG